MSRGAHESVRAPMCCGAPEDVDQYGFARSRNSFAGRADPDSG